MWFFKKLNMSRVSFLFGSVQMSILLQKCLPFGFNVLDPNGRRVVS